MFNMRGKWSSDGISDHLATEDHKYMYSVKNKTTPNLNFPTKKFCDYDF